MPNWENFHEQERQRAWASVNRPASLRGVERVAWRDPHDGTHDFCCSVKRPELPALRPARLHDLYSDEEWAAFDASLRAADRSVTQISAACFCVSLFLPIACCIVIARNTRTNRRYEAAVQAALARENERLAACGLQWCTALPDRPWNGRFFYFDLVWVDGARQQWEEAHPARRHVSAEPFPFGLLPQRTQNAIQDMARGRLATLGVVTVQADALPATAVGYPLGFDLAVLQCFAPGEPPDFDGEAAARRVYTQQQQQQQQHTHMQPFQVTSKRLDGHPAGQWSQPAHTHASAPPEHSSPPPYDGTQRM